MDKFNFQITEKQRLFIECTADKVLFGGAAGGGKTHVQVLDALIFAFRYPGSRQLILRRTYKELEESIIDKTLQSYPSRYCKYNTTSHVMRFVNGSVIYYGYCASYRDVYNYQSAEFDVIRIDEATHFSGDMISYLCTRIRGVNDFPKQLKCTSNPGNIGHEYIKAMFIDPAPKNTVFRALVGKDKNGKDIYETRLYIPCLLDENLFLADSDPNYETRLMLLSAGQFRALRYGDWDYFEGQYFSEFDRNYHVIPPMRDMPAHWRRFRAVDYGLDAFACVWAALDDEHNLYIYREHKESNLPISDAAARALDFTPDTENVYITLAPPDLWGRSQESGRVKADLFRDAGLTLTKSSNNREAGWLAIKELLRLDGDGRPKLFIFDNCTGLIHDLPALLRNPKFPSDTLDEPHDITHLPDALRYLVIWWLTPAASPVDKTSGVWAPDMLDDWRRATGNERRAMEKLYGKPPDN